MQLVDRRKENDRDLRLLGFSLIIVSAITITTLDNDRADRCTEDDSEYDNEYKNKNDYAQRDASPYSSVAPFLGWFSPGRPLF